MDDMSSRRLSRNQDILQVLVSHFHSSQGPLALIAKARKRISLKLYKYCFSVQLVDQLT